MFSAPMIELLQGCEMLVNKILSDYHNHGDLTRLELSSAAFDIILKEMEAKLIKPKQPLNNAKMNKTINGLPIRITPDSEIWFEWK